MQMLQFWVGTYVISLFQKFDHSYFTSAMLVAVNSCLSATGCNQEEHQYDNMGLLS